MKKEQVIVISLLVIMLAIAIFIVFQQGSPQSGEQLQTSSSNFPSKSEQGLGSLCSSESECVSFCQNNRGLCESYCHGTENALCAQLFPPATSAKETPRIRQETKKECEGTKTTFDFPPVNLEKTKVMLPRGLMVGDHVTPVNHHYFQNFDNKEYDIEVYAPGKGYITAIGHMPGAEAGKDYHITLQHTCTISSYYIYVSNLPEKLKTKIGDTEYATTNIPVEAGELIGYYQKNIDYNLIDEETTLTGFVIPEHYASEPYKTHIVQDTFDYFNEPIKSKLIEKNVRTAEPISGKIDYDIDGKLVGNWFLEGTNGYGGNNSEKYWLGHLSIVYDYIDPSRIVLSLQGYGGGDSKQFGVKGNAPDPASIGPEHEFIKYELVDYEYLLPNGASWDRVSFAKNLKTTSNEIPRGVVLAQLIEKRKLKFEVFPGKKASEINGFTSNAKLYER